MNLPEHKCGLYLEHNIHKNYYQKPEEYMKDHMENYEWESDETRQRAIDTDSIWTLQWYPDTPIGFCAVAAPTLEELLTFALKENS